MDNILALYGGEKTKESPFSTGNRFGTADLENLREALEQQTLFYWYGEKVKELTKKFAQMHSVDYCVATSSGTAAVHVALGACGVTAGDEVITSPVTDMGSIIGILYQNAIPVFADLDPNSYTLDPKSVEEKITDKTKAILVVHLTGGPTDMDPIMEIAKKYNLKVIEDCAQSYLAKYKGRLVGTIGDVGCFSLNDFKQISAGDGGLVIMNDQDLYETAFRFADKNYKRFDSKTASRDVPFLAPNYRMSELTGAVGLAQLDRLEGVCKRRNDIGEKISKALSKLDGITPPKVQENSSSTYWFYLFRIDEKKLNVTSEVFSKALNAEGIPNQIGYIPTCLYNYELFTNHNAYNGTNCPFGCKFNGHNISYYKGMCPVAEDILNTSIRFSLDEFYSDDDIDDIIVAITKVHHYFINKASDSNMK